MSLDPVKLEKPRCRGGKLIARCPACAEQGGDKSGDHLVVLDDGRGPFGCIANTGPQGADHRRRIWELAGDSSTTSAPRPVPLARPRATPRVRTPMPALRPLDVCAMAHVAYVRGWQYFAGLQLLTDRGMLFHADVFDASRTWPAWLITDRTRRNAQARRLDGQVWEGISGAKAKTLPGCDPAWPIGAAEIGNCRQVILCEGQPDFAASLLVAWWEGVTVAPVCMTGCGSAIHVDALSHFATKHVRIAVHDDDAGRAAAKKWSSQLYRAGADLVDGFNFHGLVRADGKPVNDLADYATLLDPAAESLPQVFQGMTR